MSPDPSETVEAMEVRKAAGKIRRWGVSNLDTDDMAELIAAGGKGCVTDQILYNLSRRGAEHHLLPWLAEHAMPVMAYSPVEQGRLVTDPTLALIAKTIGATLAQVAPAWALRHDGVIAIPRPARFPCARASCRGGPRPVADRSRRARCRIPASTRSPSARFVRARSTS